MVIYILRLYCFLKKNLSTHFPNTTEGFSQLLENISNNHGPTPFPPQRARGKCIEA